MDISALVSEINVITSDIKSAFSPFIAVGRTIAGVGSLFWICIKMWRIMASGEVDGLATHLEAFVRPFMLALLLIFYNTTLSLCDFLISPVGASTQGWAISYMEQNQALEEQYKIDLENTIKDNQIVEADNINNTPSNGTNSPVEQDEGFLDDIKNAVSDGLGTIKQTVSNIYYNVKLFTAVSWWIGMIVGIINALINVALQISYLAVLTMQNINLAILIAFGPIAIGLSVFHAFSDNWKSFYANYVGKLLWFPVANMCLAIAYRLKNISDQNAYDVLLKFAENTHILGGTIIGGSLATANSTLEAYNTIQYIDWTPVFLSIGVTIIGCFAVLKTPSLVTLIVSGASGGMTNSPISGSTFVAATSFLALKTAQTISKPIVEAARTIKAAEMARTSGNSADGGGNSGGNSNASKIYGLPQSGANTQSNSSKPANQV
ncbi:hypothetical protein VB776_07645 [Arcicella sp. DC2W]|uniref:Conjugative transposon TraJ C-terminal domain-containing protein n=1 Tax=Arcicella gelida TaxID=2984195 RepID=A0ABU5S2V7_9BACT|nr:hypothetical protein [Arcicella sp. DC2W]MEA5402782.1 hypothetical protein [Arcicella sp. DC2W]